MYALYSVLSSLPVLIVALFGAAPILFAVLLRAVRQQRPPWYVGDTMLGWFLVPLLIGTGAGGVVCLVHTLSLPASSWANATDLSVAAVLALAATAAVVALVRAIPPERAA